MDALEGLDTSTGSGVNPLATGAASGGALAVDSCLTLLGAGCGGDQGVMTFTYPAAGALSLKDAYNQGSGLSPAESLSLTTHTETQYVVDKSKGGYLRPGIDGGVGDVDASAIQTRVVRTEVIEAEYTLGSAASGSSAKLDYPHFLGEVVGAPRRDEGALADAHASGSRSRDEHHKRMSGGGSVSVRLLHFSGCPSAVQRLYASESTMSFLLPLGTRAELATSTAQLQQYTDAALKLFDGLDESNLYHTCGPADYELPHRNYTAVGEGFELFPHDARFFSRFALRQKDTSTPIGNMNALYSANPAM